MATLCKTFAVNLLKSPLSQRQTWMFAPRLWCATMAAGSTEHTLSVKKRISDTKAAALQGGGPKRIQKQHDKVSSFSLIKFS